MKVGVFLLVVEHCIFNGEFENVIIKLSVINLLNTNYCRFVLLYVKINLLFNSIII